MYHLCVSIWILSSILFNLVCSLQFDYGIIKNEDVKVIEKYKTIRIRTNLTEQLIGQNLHSCVETSLDKEKIENINHILTEEFNDLIKELGLFFPESNLIWVLHWTNCNRYPSICGQEGKGCCILNQFSEKDQQTCFQRNVNDIRYIRTKQDGDSKLFSSQCIRLNLEDYENFASKTYFPTESWREVILNNYARSSFDMRYKSHNLRREATNLFGSVHDEDLNTITFADFWGNDYDVIFNYTSTWLDNTGFNVVQLVMSSDGNKEPIYYQRKFDIKVVTYLADNSIRKCSLIKENYLARYNYDFLSVSFSCPEIQVKMIQVSLTITEQVRIHEIIINRPKYEYYVKKFHERYFELKQKYESFDEEISSSTEKPNISVQPENGNTTELLPLNPVPFDDTMSEGSGIDLRDVTNIEVVNSQDPIGNSNKTRTLSLEEILNLGLNNSNSFEYDDEDFPVEGSIAETKNMYPSFENENITYHDRYIDIETWERLSDFGRELVSENASLQRIKRSLLSQIHRTISYWGRLGPLTNFYNNEQFDIIDGSIQDLKTAIQQERNFSYSVNKRMKENANDLIRLICVGDQQVQMEMLRLEAKTISLEYKLEIREIVNSCRNQKLPLNVARQFRKIYCKENLTCDMLKLFRCELKSYGLTFSKPREIHIHLQIQAPETNSLKVYRIYPIPFTIPRNVERLRNDLHNFRHRTLVDILTPKKFDEENSIQNIRALTTMQITNLPKYVIVNNEKVICETETISNDLIMVDDCSPSELYVKNDTLSFNFTKAEKTIKSYENVKCSIRFLPSLQSVLINSNEKLRIFRASVRDPRYCTKNCILKQDEKSPDCFEHIIYNPYKTESVEVNIDLDKFVNQNNSDIFNDLAMEIAEKINHKQMSKDEEELNSLYSKMKSGIDDQLTLIIIIFVSLICFILGCVTTCYIKTKISTGVRYTGAASGLVFRN